MKNQIAGRYLVVGAMMPPALVLLSDGAHALYDARCSVSGMDAARAATFGALVDYAFQVNDAMLCYIMERAVADGLPHADTLSEMAARIVQGLPIGNGRDYFEGGESVTQGKPMPRKPRPGGIAVAIPQAVQS